MADVKSVLSGRESSSPFDPIPAGEYSLHIDDATVDDERTSVEGKHVPPSVRVKLTVQDEVEGAKGRSLWHRFYIDLERNQGFLMKFYRLATGMALGEQIEGDATELDVARVVANGVVGGTVSAKVGIRVDKRTGEEVNTLNRLVEG